MDVSELSAKPHVVCVPLPAQGHINPMLTFAKLLHVTGFHVTFVLTHFNFNRLLNFRGPHALHALPGFRFEPISDGLSPANKRGILDLPALCRSMPVHGLTSFRDLIARMGVSSSDVPPVTCIVSDGVMSFTLKVAQEFNIPDYFLFTPSACGLLGYLNFHELQKRGFFPFKDEKNVSDGYLETQVDWIPAMGGIRLKDLPTFFRTTDPDDTMFNYNIEQVSNAMNAKGVILNTFQDLEAEVLEAIRSQYPNLYPIGPLPMLHKQLSKSNTNNQLEPIDLNLWEPNNECLKWLDNKEKGSVVYVNFGSLVIMNPKQLREFAWGLANSKWNFLWVIRPNLVEGGDEVISEELKEETRERGLFVGWCPQERVLGHPSVGGFLSHCGWNSTLESISEGVPMACWPFFAEQQTNCFYACGKWGIGMEIGSDVKREEVEGLVRELMGGERGKKMRDKAVEWKQKAHQATSPGGSSYTNFITLVSQMKQATTTPISHV